MFYRTPKIIGTNKRGETIQICGLFLVVFIIWGVLWLEKLYNGVQIKELLETS